MISHVSGNHSNNTLSRPSGGAAAHAHSGARVLVHAAATLSLAGPRRAAGAERSRRRTAVRVTAPTASPVPGLAQRTKTERRSGVRVREAAATRVQETVQERVQESQEWSQDDGQTVEKARRSAQLARKKSTQARGRRDRGRADHGSGSTATAGSRRRQRRSEALDDFSVVRGRSARGLSAGAQDEKPSRAGRSRRHDHHCLGVSLEPLGQNNFTRIIKERPEGCYRLTENISLAGDHAAALPLGDRSRPFHGTLDGQGHSLSVKLTREQGDAVLFGCIHDSHLNLTVTDSHLETRNGSRAALIGEMTAFNWVRVNRLDNSLLSATGEGDVMAGLVAQTTDIRNEIELGSATSNQVLARALPRSGTCSGSCAHTAAVSLGLGVLSDSDQEGYDRSSDWQNVWQYNLHNNSLQAEAQGAANTESGNRTASAAAGLVGILGDRTATPERLWALQKGVDDNRIEARVRGGRGVAGSYSHASLGYACTGCDFLSRAPDIGGKELTAAQIDFSRNRLQASSGPGSDARPADESLPAVARANLVSTAPVHFLEVHHSSVDPGQLVAEVEGGTDRPGAVTERALLPAVEDAWLFLFSAGAADLPLFAGSEQDLHPFASRAVSYRTSGLPFGRVDLAGYEYASSSAQAPALASRVAPLAVNSLDPAGWRKAQHDLTSVVSRSYRLWGCGFNHNDASLHYPHEALQSLVTSDADWWLVTRQRYPGHRKSDQQGLLRLSHYQAPVSQDQAPQPLAGAAHGGIQLYQPRSGDPVLQDGLPVSGLVHGRFLFQLYQGPGQSAQLVRLPLDLGNGRFSLTQYDTLAGQARLLSVEKDELHLWTQEGNDSLWGYGLGLASGGLYNTSTRLYWGFDLSDQPGGKVLLARAGDFLYSLRQEEGQPASLRRLPFSTVFPDPDWQRTWPANLSESLHLVMAGGQLTAVPPGALADPAAPTFGFQARVPDAGGCVQWSPIALEAQPLPADSTLATTTVGAQGTAGSGAEDGRPDPESTASQDFVQTLFTTFGITAGVGGLAAVAVVAAVCTGACVADRRRRSRVAAAAPDARQPDRQPLCEAAGKPVREAMAAESAV